MRPQPRLRPCAARDDLGARTETLIGVQNRCRQALEIGRFFSRDVEMTQLNLGLGPSECLGAVKGAAVMVLVDHVKKFRARRCNHRPKCDPRHLARRDGDALAKREDRIQYGSNGIRKRSAVHNGRSILD